MSSSPRFALLSVSDKTGIVELGQALVRHGFTILSTGGTARALRAGGVAVTSVSDHTGHPEVMNGRVKTLHPRIHAAILGLRDQHADEAAAHDIPWIDLVAVNLYPFEATITGPDGQPRADVDMAAATEQIDIGGPTMVRASAKNHAHVTIITRPDDYAAVIAELDAGGVSAATRLRLAVAAFQHTAAYDGVISGWLARQAAAAGALDEADAAMPREGALPLRKVQDCRYGENPHQRAAFYAEPAVGGRSLAHLRQHQGKELSYNNIADLDAALRSAFALDTPTCIVVKHANPCGAATHTGGAVPAFELALSADPVSAFGGIVAFNRPLDGDAVRAIRKSRTFFEIVAAPGFTDEALELLAPRERMRVMELPADWADRKAEAMDIKRVQGGFLLQDWDLGPVPGAPDWKVAGQHAPTDEQASTLRFAWAMCRHVKSNAIVLAKAVDGGFVLNGVGAGQMSRVDSVRLAVDKATRPVAGSVLASDAFFPFPDGPQVALDAGVAAFVQPGGSVKDDEVLAAADAAGVPMVFTGVRHFWH
ncbi:MAG: bifunctional phosphoribosylaminoimidazolecarboxamide formyltransferase/IMP cyclohydrolase [Alphaproteobacteria bacterium]|nr:bifunctional phosphoribosylaminoimidazolecarboxamide formyltransferase/IMP cyclohydrolase [Alphaproteobacteria bacterium]